MANRPLHRDDPGTASLYPNFFSAPAPGFGAWDPIFAEALKYNAAAHETFGTFLGEWQSFLARRLEADVALMQHLAQCKSAEAVFSAYADFWQRAAEDYGKEFSVMSKIAGGAASSMTTAVQSAVQKAGIAPHPRKAA